MGICTLECFTQLVPHLQSTHERDKDLHAEAEGLLEEVLNNAEGRVGYPPPKPKARSSRSTGVSQEEKVRTELSIAASGVLSCAAQHAGQIMSWTAALHPLWDTQASKLVKDKGPRHNCLHPLKSACVFLSQLCMLQRQIDRAVPDKHPVGPQAKKLKLSPPLVRALPRPKRAPIPDDIISDVGTLSALAGQDRAFLDPSQMPGRSQKRLLPGEPPNASSLFLPLSSWSLR